MGQLHLRTVFTEHTYQRLDEPRSIDVVPPREVACRTETYRTGSPGEGDCKLGMCGVDFLFWFSFKKKRIGFGKSLVLISLKKNSSVWILKLFTFKDE